MRSVRASTARTAAPPVRRRRTTRKPEASVQRAAVRKKGEKSRSASFAVAG